MSELAIEGIWNNQVVPAQFTAKLLWPLIEGTNYTFSSLEALKESYKTNPKTYKIILNKYKYLSRYVPRVFKGQYMEDFGICSLVSTYVKLWPKDIKLADQVNHSRAAVIHTRRAFTYLLISLKQSAGVITSSNYPVEGCFSLFSSQGKWEGERGRRRHELCKLMVKLMTVAAKAAEEELANG